MQRGKRYKDSIKNYDPRKVYNLEAGIEKVKELSYSNFTGTLEVHADIFVPKDRDAKSIKGAYTLPHSSGDVETKIAVFCTPELEDEANKAGADIVGLEKLTKDVKAGNIDFDVAIATPSVMPQIAALGRELGPRGLMPNPKNGTVTDDLVDTIKEYKQGKQTFACDESGVIHLRAGKLDMDTKDLKENVEACIKAILETLNKPYEQAIDRLHLAPTMGASVKITYSIE
jgi:large subunit ribosomal protein L1